MHGDQDAGPSITSQRRVEVQDSIGEDDSIGKRESTSTHHVVAKDIDQNTALNGKMSGQEFREKHIRIAPYEGEKQMQIIMDLIDGELSEPYTVYTYRYFLNQWPELCFLAHYSPPVGTNLTKARPSTDSNDTIFQSSSEQPIGVVIGKLDKHLKGNRFMRGYIGMVSIRSDFRGKGIATVLLQTLLRKMVDCGAQEIVLETEIDNHASLQLYEKLGFIREKRLFNFYLNGKDCFRLIAEIPKSSWQIPLTPPPPPPVQSLQPFPPPPIIHSSSNNILPAQAFADLRISPSQIPPTSARSQMAFSPSDIL